MTNPVTETVDIDKPIRCPNFNAEALADTCNGCECAPLCMEKRGIIEVEP
jgi:hypothetical protein